jgi:hypothetical protein
MVLYICNVSYIHLQKIYYNMRHIPLFLHYPLNYPFISLVEETLLFMYVNYCLNLCCYTSCNLAEFSAWSNRMEKFLNSYYFKPFLGVPLFHSYMKEVGARILGKVAFLVWMKRYAFCSCTAVVMCWQYLSTPAW